MVCFTKAAFRCPKSEISYLFGFSKPQISIKNCVTEFFSVQFRYTYWFSRYQTQWLYVWFVLSVKIKQYTRTSVTKQKKTKDWRHISNRIQVFNTLVGNCQFKYIIRKCNLIRIKLIFPFRCFLFWVFYSGNCAKMAKFTGLHVC